MKAKFCDECRYHSFTDDGMICAKSHKPRFYKPRTDHVLEWDWGHKRRCADFVEKPVRKSQKILN